MPELERALQTTIRCETLERVLDGVAVAAKAPTDTIDTIRLWIATLHREAGEVPHRDEPNSNSRHLTLSHVLRRAKSEFPGPGLAWQLVRLVLGVAYLSQSGERHRGTIATDVALAWQFIFAALTGPVPLCSASRSAQGFLSVPLCSLIDNGRIDQLWRLHVWLPDAQRGNPEFSIHTHQSFAQSWILAGSAFDHSYTAQPVSDIKEATHAKYRLAWNDGKSADSKYKTHQVSSTVVNTGELVHTALQGSEINSRDTSYTIPQASFHRTEVPPESIHATLFVFDSRRGFEQDAPVLGPKEGESFTQDRDPAGTTPASLARVADAVRIWEAAIARGREHARCSEWEYALKEYHLALDVCQKGMQEISTSRRYECLTLGELGNTYRRFGRYDHAVSFLQSALVDMEHGSERVELTGGLGVVYRHMNQLAEAKLAFEDQYNTAKQLQIEDATCRAIGNVGMVNYQLAQMNNDPQLLELAVQQLSERVRLAKDLAISTQTRPLDPDKKAHLINSSLTWEAIGQSRLSLCFCTQGRFGDAVTAAAESLETTLKTKDPTMIAMSYFFYGHALYLNGNLDEARAQFNSRGACTPVMAFCKEPSEENCLYIQEMIDVGVDLDVTDDKGYTALDYAVFSGNTRTEQLILEGLRRTLSNHEDIASALVARHRESQVRKVYRELIQEKFRPKLLAKEPGSVQKLRHTYSRELATDEKKKALFAPLKFVQYSDLVKFGRLPRSSDNLAQDFAHQDELQECPVEYMIFISYRWINRLPTVNSTTPGAKRHLSPDNENNTQYKRMIRAVEEFLRVHPSVDADKLGIWIVRDQLPSPPSLLSHLPHFTCLYTYPNPYRITFAWTKMIPCPGFLHCP